MNNELLNILNYMEKERGLDREVLIQAVEYALQSVSRKSAGLAKDLRIEIDRETCDIKAFAQAEVVEHPRRSRNDEISLTRAEKIKLDAKIGDFIEIEITPRNLGRIAAQTAKQAIFQKIRQAEKSIVFEEYKNRIGDIVSGAVRQFNRNDIIVDLGRAEAIIPAKERVPTEEYQIGDRIRGYILNVQDNSAGPCIILSRSHPNFVKALFGLEVAEIADSIVEIKGIAREPGFRTKIAVLSHDEKVDPVGACVGMRGIRVKNIVRELSGEKIDIIRWSDDIKTYITNALSPAKLSKVTIDPDVGNLMHVVADSEQLSLAIGKRGQNVRLSAKLAGWKIDIQKDESDISFEEKVAKAVDNLAGVDGISRENAETLVKAGFLTTEGILAAEVGDLKEMTGLDIETAKAIYEAATAAQPEESEPADQSASSDEAGHESDAAPQKTGKAKSKSKTAAKKSEPSDQPASSDEVEHESGAVPQKTGKAKSKSKTAAKKSKPADQPASSDEAGHESGAAPQKTGKAKSKSKTAAKKEEEEKKEE